jgi:hypothetical protein
MRLAGQLLILLVLMLAGTSTPAIGPESGDRAPCSDCATDACPDCDECPMCVCFPVTSPAVFQPDPLAEGPICNTPCSASAEDPVIVPGFADIFHPPRSC